MPANRMSGNGLSVGIIGTGPGGLALGIFLRKAGFRDFTYSLDLNANWSRMWSAQPEILEYFEQCTQRYGLGSHLKLNT